MAARKVTADSGGAASVKTGAVAVADAYKNHTSLLVGGVEVKIVDGKVNVSAETAKYLKANGYLK